MNKKICIINCFWGKWPEWFYFFIESCKNNPNINWILFSDNTKNLPKVNNICFIPLPREEFNSLATHKLGFKVEIKNPYKVCDFKPAYGKIFEDYLSDYNFWGYCDIDIIFGKILDFLPHELLKNYDIVSIYKGFLSGPFCLFKNETKINILFQKHNDYQSILQDPKYLGFDENIKNKVHKDFYFIKFRRLLQFSLLSIKIFILLCSKIKEFRYQFQWFYKQKNIKNDHPTDMTEIVFSLANNHKIKVLFKDLMKSDIFFKRVNKKNWRLIWKNGRLFDNTTNKEIFAFHFRKLKNHNDFIIEQPEFQISSFCITHQGISNDQST